ncbi:MAG TPA: EGF domain-containing protein [Polyangium sp.]|nr:EGF domain-containing protein [Polyangium sp.]
MKYRRRAAILLSLFATTAPTACGGGQTPSTTGDGGQSNTGGSGGDGGAASSSSGMGGQAGDPFAKDECALGLDDCADNADCLDTPGFYECVCKPGFSGDGKTCTDIDECGKLTNDCDPNALCTNTDGGFTCACAAGFVGDGKTCAATYLAVSAGTYHACAVRSDKTLWCWGLNTSGQAGTGTGDAIFLRPAQAGGASDWKAVSSGAASTCALSELGRISCFGTNSSGQLGDGSTTTRTTPTPIAGDMSDWTSISAGSTHVCALRADGSLYCWGSNTRGQIGDGTTNNAILPTLVSAGPWVAVSAGTDFTCGLRMDHTLWCWGLNTSRQLGDTTTTQRMTPTQEITMATDWAAIGAGNAYTCAMKMDGTRYCWGTNSLGQGADGTTTGITMPKACDMETDWGTNIELGDLLGCAQKKTGALYCWGDGSSGQTGLPGDESPKLAPAQVGQATDWISISSGFRFTCGVRQSGELHCWGANARAAAGMGFVADRLDPTNVSADTDWERVDVQLDNGCGLRTGGNLYCWGRNAFGHLGDGTNITRVAPTPIGAGKVWTRVALGRTHTCAIASEGGGTPAPYCWGLDGNQELGNGSTVTNQLTPMPVTPTTGNTSPWLEIAAGFNHTCAVRQDGTLWCWGRNASGQLGDGTTTTRPDPKQVILPDPLGWLDVHASGDFTCGMRTGGELYCWGTNTVGQLGQMDTMSPVSSPKLVPGTFANVDVSANHVCGVRVDGTLWCWGRNASGELGMGNTASPVLGPTQVGTGTNWQRPYLGQGTSMCATQMDGSLHCWGTGSFGQLGLGNTSSFTSPQKVPNLDTWKSASIGVEHTCGITQGGKLACWGASYYAQLGGGVPFISTPTRIVDP